MPLVLVHGVPETERVWEDLVSHLSRSDVVTLTLPGFGAPLPAGFRPTMDGYAEWLTAELERIDGPIDLVGHDWGGGLVLRAISLRPELVRSWVTDVASFAAPEGRWHDLALIWQTPGEGEAFMDGWLASEPEQRANVFPGSREIALAMAGAFGRTMADAILSLYRSATSVHTEWGAALTGIPKPGLAIVAGKDEYQSAKHSLRGAERVGARVVELDELGHWWMLEDPAGSAMLLEDFWATI